MSSHFAAHRAAPLVACAAAALVAALALVGPAAADSDQQLLKTFEPLLVFHPNEHLRPTKVQSFIEDSALERFVGSSAQQVPLDPFWTVVDPDPEPGELGSLAPGLYRLDQVGCHAFAPLADGACYAAAWSDGSGGDAVYGRVVRTGTQIVLQYWLFYYDNPLLLPPAGAFWQSHEGDWELVNVILDAAGEPQQAAYSQHCSGQRMAWSDPRLEIRDGTHPVAYVALGSHANYFQPPGAVPITCLPPGVPALPFIVDQVLAGPTTKTSIHEIEGMPWSEFPGYWGESEYFFTPVPFPPFPAGALPVGHAPASPPLQASWNVQTVLGWPPAP